MSVSTIYKLAAEMSTRGNLPSGVAAANKQLKSMQSNIGGINSSVSNLGRSIGSGAFQTAAAITKGAGAAGAAAAGVAAGMLAKGGLAAAASTERLQSTLAGTLQLYNHSAGATDQIGANLKVAAQAMRELNDIADSSPGELDDVSKMFQNMLPGARSVTGDMKRIMTMTQNLALFTPTLTGGDFMTSGAQMSRILTGSAGAEMDTWKRLAPVIADVGVAMKKTAGAGNLLAEGLTGDKLTMAFNKLSGEDRMRLVEESFRRGGPALAKMYAASWEGASSSALSSVKKVRNAVMAPIFDRVKKAAIRHTEDPNSLLGKNRTAKMVVMAGQIGSLMAKPVERALERISQGFRYVQENTYAVANRVYQAFQVAGALIRGAATFMLARMMVGAGLIAAAAAGRAVGGVARGAKAAYGATRDGISGIGKAATATSKFFKSFSGGGAVSSSLGLFTSLGSAFGSMAKFGLILVPMILMAAAAFALLAIPLIAAGGIAAYIASKWSELSASIVQGFNDGSLSIRPLIVAALILWERLKRLGEAFIGGQTGATMMQKAINMATSIINGLSEGVAIMAQVAAGMLTIIGKLANLWESTFGESDIERVAKRQKQLMDEEGMSFEGSQKRVQAEYANGFLSRGRTFGDDAQQLADKINEAAKSWRATDIKSLNEGDISSWTDTVTASILDAFKPKEEEKKTPKGPRVNVQNLYQNIDLRGEDPDRALSALITPIENLARRPTVSGSDTVGGMG